MSIVAYVGRTGSGKSYGVVENVIIPALKAGRHIVTNIPLKVGYLTDDFSKGKITQFDPKAPLEDSEFFNPDNFAGCIVVIDEAWRYWSVGTKANKIPEMQKGFFTEHRHYVGEDGRTTEIVLVTQSLDQIANFVRELIEDTYRATKLSALGMSKSYKIDVFTGCQKGLSGGTPNRTLQGTYKPEIFKYYKSHTKNKTDFAAGMEEKSDNRNNIFKSKFFLIVIPAAILIIIFAIINLFSYFTVDENIIDNPSIVEPVNSKPSKKFIKPKAQDLSLLAKKAMLKSDLTKEFLPLSKNYRIVGSINNSLMITSRNGDRTVNKKLCGNFSNTKEDYCVLNGELVTWYSSNVPRNETPSSISYDIENIF